MQRLFCVLALMALGVFVVAGSGCAARPAGGGGGGTNTNDNNVNDNNVNDNNVNDNNVNDNNVNDNNVNDNNVNDNEAPALVKTQISLGNTSGGLHRIEAGDDLVVFASPDSIEYIVPTEYDDTITEGTPIPGAATLYETRTWKVEGKKVALTTSAGRVAIYDTVAGGNPVEVSGVTLAALPVEPYVAGHMASAGDYFGVICDPNEVNDGNPVKVIDVSGDTPAVISFPTPASAMQTDTPEQIVVDDSPARVAVVWYNYIYVWDITAPADPALEFEFNLGSALGDLDRSVQIALDGDYIIFRGDRLEGVVGLLNIADGTVTELDNKAPNSPNEQVALAAGSFGYFAAEESVDQIFTGGYVVRTTIGTTDDPTALVAPNRLDEPVDVESDDCISTPGKYGYGSSIAITPDGARWFIAGIDAVDRDIEFLQMSTGGAFELFEETETAAEGRSQSGYIMASDVSASANTVAFWTLRQFPDSGCITDDDWAVGFIVLDRLED
ncbi:MAG: hypothetical protein JXB13_14025 [Phycisphaerae bacterium]|nr:hypothetical protein [Phycisphaerae bacterium]